MKKKIVLFLVYLMNKSCFHTNCENNWVYGQYFIGKMLASFNYKNCL